ncbi:MAG: circadian clock protein KaiC [Opitutales bacterium]
MDKVSTYITGFDHISMGGLPAGRPTLITGSAGSAKTVLAAQFLVAAILEDNESGVFVTLEETPTDIRQNMASFGWDITAFEEQKKWAFVDGSPESNDFDFESGPYDLGAFLARLEHAVRQTNATRVVIDSVGAILSRYGERSMIRQEIHRITAGLKQMGVTAIITAERTDEYGPISRYNLEEFVADNVIVLRNVLEQEKRRRTIEILKFRGTSHQKGEYPFTIIPREGVVVIPLSAIELGQRSSLLRVSSGISELDRMCGGGFFRDSIVLVSGATGTGKTLMVTEFLKGGVNMGERVLLFAFEESREQLIRNASGWGVDFEQMENEGKLKIVCAYPETAGLEDHLIRMKETIQSFQPNRVALDSLSALERVATFRGFREFVIGLTSAIKEEEIAGLFTSTTPTLLGGTSITEAHISTITDSIILLRYAEILGEMRRGITVLKMRGSVHDKDIREFTIDREGMHIGPPFRNISGILTGNPQHIKEGEIEQLQGMFLDAQEREGGQSPK